MQGIHHQSLLLILHVALLHFPFSLQEIDFLSALYPELQLTLAVAPNVEMDASSSVAVPFVIGGSTPQSRIRNCYYQHYHSVIIIIIFITLVIISIEIIITFSTLNLIIV
jgi:hypothetical protein